jgi:hypothetical protein
MEILNTMKIVYEQIIDLNVLEKPTTYIFWGKYGGCISPRSNGI